MGNIPADTVILNGILFNAFTGEFIPGESIWIKGGMIAYVGPEPNPLLDKTTHVIDAKGQVLLPGLIDGHTHAGGNRVGVEEYIKYVIPSGVTTMITETIEISSATGKEGMDFLVKGLDGQPIRIYYTVAPLCGLIPETESKALKKKEYLPLLKDPKCVGVGEVFWRNILLRGSQGKRVQEMASMAHRLGKRVEGHGAGASGTKLQAYTCFGVSSDHEPITEKDVLERLRLGYWVMIREGAVRKELPGVKGIFDKRIDFRRLILVTDGMDPEGFIEEGYLDASLKRAIKLGVPPGVAYQMVTLNVAEHFRLDHLIGSLSPGKMADIVMIPSIEDFSPRLILCGGKAIFENGKRLVEPKKVFFPDHMFETAKGLVSIHPTFPERGKVRVMELVTRLVTRERVIDLEDPDESKDVLMVLAQDRVGAGRTFLGLLKGFGLQRGAYGSTMCWDTTDMIVVGCDAQSMKTAIERLKTVGGGGVYAIGDDVVAELPAPLGGVVSLKPMETVREEVKKIEESLKKNGVPWEKSLLTVDTLGTPAIPHLRVTHRGYVRLKDLKVLPLEA